MDEKSNVRGREADLEELRKNINQTKSDIDDTLQRIKERYGKERLKEDAMKKVGELGGKASSMLQEMGEELSLMGNKIVDRVKKHPIPYVAAGAGIGALAFSIYRIRNKNGGNRPEDAIAGEERAREVYETTQYPEERGFAEEIPGRSADEAGEYAGFAGEAARRQLERTPSEFLENVKEHPFGTGIAMFCLGLSGGLLLPAGREKEISTAAEDRGKEKVGKMTEESWAAAAEMEKVAAEVTEEKPLVLPG